MLNKKNLPLYIALAIPVLMIVVLAIAIYVPGLSKHPTHNFLYITGDEVSYGYPDGDYYSVANGHLVKNSNPPPPNYPKTIPSTSQRAEVKFYVYNVTTDQAQEISFAEAQKLNLDSSLTSPDDYQVMQGNGGDFPFGGGGDYNSWYLRGHNRSKKLNLKLSGSNNYGNFRFLGWVN